MAKSKNEFSKKQKSTSETSESITDQIEKFLSSGGEIKQVDSGVSGVAPKSGGRQHITITPKKPKA